MQTSSDDYPNNSNKEEGLIDTSSPKQDKDEEEENHLLNSNKSKEKLLYLKDGNLLWRKICYLFLISIIVFVTSLSIGIATDLKFIFALTGISGLSFLFCLVFCTCCNGFITIEPNEAIVYHYYGRYLGTVKESGFFYGYPLSSIHKISLKTNQYNGNRLKVNERDGNPVELGIIVVWKIGDTAKAIFDVENYWSFIEAQAEAAIRYIGCKYPYEPVIPGEVSLRSGNEIINKELRQELERRIAVSGIIIEDARVTEISYGEEVANMMLQKQASKATVFAKDAVVKGATKAVMDSLKEFEQKGIVFNDREKSKYITEMMNTLCTSQGVHKIM